MVQLDAFYADLDGGDKEKHLTQLKKCPTPSCIVETANGFHVYWNCKPNTIMEENALTRYNTVIRKLITALDADTCHDLSRVLRPPNFLHLKDANNPFMIKEIFESSNTVSLKQMEYWFKNVEPWEAGKKTKSNKPKKETSTIISSDDFWDRANSLDAVQSLTKLSETEAVEFDKISFKDKQIVCDDKPTGAWVDGNGKIGSHSGGGPTIVNWLNWYWDDMATVAKHLKEHFPEITHDNNPVTIG